MNPLTKRVLQAPEMWAAAAQVKIARAMGRREVTVLRAGLSITCGTGDGQGSFCAIAGHDYEPELQWLLNKLQLGDTFVDVGANIGIYSLHAARRLKESGKVFALEPSPEAVDVFKRNIEQNGFSSTIIPVHAAASRRPGCLYLAGDRTKWNSLQLHDHPPGIFIDVTTVDEVLADSKARANFHFLKIDAEGVESDVLEGAKNSILSTWPVIIFENSINRSDELPTTWLRHRGYTIYAVERQGNLAKLTSGEYAHYTNLIAIHPRSRSRH